MKVYLAADHAGFELKGALLMYVRDELGHEAEDCGAHSLDPADDYPGIIAAAAKKLAADFRRGIESRAIFLGASGQGEAMAANRFKDVRCAVYYGDTGTRQRDLAGEELDVVRSSRRHNDANALSLGARFLAADEAKRAVALWLETGFSREERHVRRVEDLGRVG